MQDRQSRTSAWLLACTITLACAACTAEGAAPTTAPAQPKWLCQQPGGCYIGNGAYCPGVPQKCPPAGCNPAHGLYNASKVINGDYNSFFYSGGPNHPPVVTTAGECCEQCKNNRTCNVWNFCSEPNGCGPRGSCSAFQKSIPLYPKPGALTGQFYRGCTKDGRFLQLACVLRQAKNTQSVPLTNRWVAQWTSGKLPSRKF
mmetsp:Transcript_148/g.467  ORF Transcript_148/g.467 Transcript_148/m.467 type:complete len:201 (-) Transcript_148:323-925(-)